MKSIYIIILSSCLSFSAKSQSQVHAVDVAFENLYVRDSVHVVGRLDLEFPVAGRVFVTFDGEGSASPNDRIIMAANRLPKWEVNHGHSSFMSAVYGERHCFSHTRSFDIPAGQHSFYAVATNFADVEGDGIASAYGTLFVEFIPQNSNVVSGSSYMVKQFEAHEPVVIDSVTIQATGQGKAEVRFNGMMAGYENDIFIVGITDTKNWNYTDPFGIAIENNNPYSPSISLSDTRVFVVPGAGSYTFYVMAHRGYEVTGTGLVWALSSLNGRFYPQASGIEIVSHRVPGPNLQLDVNTIILDSIEMNIPTAGYVEIRFDGALKSPLGHEILIAVSDAPSYTLQNGSIILRTNDKDLDRHPVNHTLVKYLQPGNHTFYIMAENYQATEATEVDLFGDFMVKYYGQTIVSANNEFTTLPMQVWPNPAKDIIHVQFDASSEDIEIMMYDMQGRMVAGNSKAKSNIIETDHLEPGMYVLQVKYGNKIGIEKVMVE